MGRGRKPAPTPIKILKGTRKDRINAEEPRPEKVRPKRPEELDLDAAAEWDRIVPQLEALGVLSEVDGAALAIYCDAYSQWINANREIAAYGMLVDTGMGGLKANPAVAIARQAMSMCHRLLSEFGCTPASRGKVKVKSEAPTDALSDFLARRKA